MVRIKPLKIDQAQGQTKDIFEAMRKNFGMVPNLFATIANYPKALEPLLDLYQAISKESTIEPRLQELANLEVSRINRCNYCLAHHSQMAKMVGVSDEQLNMLKAGETVQNFTPLEKATDEVGSSIPHRADGGLMPPSAQTVREPLSSLTGFTEKEKTVIEYARQVTKDAEAVPDDLFKRLSSYFTESEIVNLTLIIGLMNVFNRFNGALGVELEK